MDKNSTSPLNNYRSLLKKVVALKPKHEADLPNAIVDLSMALTSERGEGIKTNYLSSPRARTAYLYYFLPWNLYRLGQLLPHLTLELKEGATIIDLGSGPLTLPQGLWLHRPELREKKLHFICLDQTLNLMKIGKDLTTLLIGPQCPWTFELQQSPLHKLNKQGIDLIAAMNVINELSWIHSEKSDEIMEKFILTLSKSLSAEGQLLFIEPGMRTSSYNLIHLREQLLNYDFSLLAPCTHHQECPMSKRNSKMWCHFNYPSAAAPAWLHSLSQKAELEKNNVSLSFLQASKKEVLHQEHTARIVSEPFALPDRAPYRVGQYGCTAKGLVLFLCKQAKHKSGDVIQFTYPKEMRKDPKSQAPEIPL